MSNQVASVVDLTGEDTTTQVTANDGSSDSEEDSIPQELLCSATLTAVGLRYYNGVAHRGEMVNLVREPNNPYDRNAIRVDNIHGQKVGHIKATQAKFISRVMDSMAGYGVTAIDGKIPSPAGTFTQPIDIEIIGNEATRDKLDNLLKSGGIKTKANKKSRANSIESSSDQRKSSVQSQTTIVKDWKSQKDLDTLFDQQKKLLDKVPDIDPPVQLTSTLLPHQIKGLNWMVYRETHQHEHLFFQKIKEQGKTKWLSEITMASQTKEPRRVQGGLLCDDMGLGKSIMTLCLILSNPPLHYKYPLGDNETTDNNDLLVTQCQKNTTTTSAASFVPSNIPPGGITTLIVCPVSVMSNWIDQVRGHFKPNVLRIEMYQGSDRQTVLQRVLSNEIDILLVSYQTLAFDYRSQFDKQGNKISSKKRKKGNASIFCDISFHRVVLDEAHIIRNNKTQTCKAVLKLQATYKFGLTGTIIQNKPDDICPLLKFIGVEPIGEHNVFRRAISQPIRNGDVMGLTRLRAIMCAVSLRRNKNQEGIKLTNKTVQLCSVEFPKGSVHESIYDTLFDSARAAFSALIDGGEENALKHYLSILESLMRIRQACCSGLLVPKDRLARAEEVLAEIKDRAGKNALTPDEGKILLDKLKGIFTETSDSNAECAVCLEEIPQEDAIILRKCTHVYCRCCIEKISSMNKTVCPLCRQEFQSLDMVNMKDASAAATKDTNIEDEHAVSKECFKDEEELGNSPKIISLLTAIDAMKSDEKGVIFSQWTSFLDIVGEALDKANHQYTRIDGKMNAKARVDAMSAFNADAVDSPRFILCSLHAAGTGINLTRGNHCFFLDTWWNKGAEDQAMDRVHRIGQSRDVTIIKFVMKDSIEERLIKLQQAKAVVGKGALEKLSPEEIRQARVSDLMDLFAVGKEKFDE